MTIVSLVTLHPNPGVAWDNVQKQLKKGCDLARKHGAEDDAVDVDQLPDEKMVD